VGVEPKGTEEGIGKETHVYSSRLSLPHSGQ
jgi:hypothetical protein